jgi:hypothetical protein
VRAKVENSFAPQLFHNLVASVQAADGGVGGMARSARNYELAIAALAGALATVTFLFLWERSSIEAAAKALEATRADRSRPVEWRTSYWPALGLLPPDHQGQIDEVGPIESDSPYDVFSPYLHNAPANRPATASTAPRPTRTAAPRPSVPKPPKASDPVAAPDFWVPDVSSLLVPAASVAMLAIPLAELGRAKDSNLIVWSPPPIPSADPPGLGGPFHLFFTTESPTGVAPVAEAGGGGVTSSTASTLTSAVSSTTSGVEGLASSTTSSLTGLASSTTSSLGGLTSSTTSAATGLISSTTSSATGLVSSVLRRH